MRRHIEVIRTIGNELRGRREEKKVQVKEVAESIGVSSTYISEIERNGKVPSKELIEKLSREYEISRCRLYRGFRILPDPMLEQLCGVDGIYDVLFYLSEDETVSQEERVKFYLEIVRLYREKFKKGGG